MEKQKLIRENFPSHQFIHLRLFAFNEYPPTAGMRIRVSSLAFISCGISRITLGIQYVTLILHAPIIYIKRRTGL